MPPETQPSPVVVAPTAAVLRSSITLLKDAWGFYAAQIGTLLAISAIPVVIVTAIMALGTFGLAGTFETFIQTREFSQTVITALIAVALGVVLIFIATVWGGAALLTAVTDSDGRTSVTEAYGKGWRMLSAYIWISILSGLCIMVGLILLIIPGIIVGVWLSLSVYVLAAEGVRGTDALRKSKSYVQGHWWAVFGRLCVVYLLYLVLAIAVNAVEYAVEIPKDSASFLVNIIVTPFLVIYIFLVYQDLKALATTAR